ncbi:MAG: hypothetical protein ACI8QC_004242 [Planctomycetota bacterium]|jgi:hypothetical protein
MCLEVARAPADPTRRCIWTGRGVNRLLRVDQSQVYSQILASPGQGRVVWSFMAEVRQIQYGTQEAFGLPKRQAEDETEGARRLDARSVYFYGAPR